MALIDSATQAGARLDSACRSVGITARTLQRWQREPTSEDRRRGPLSAPGHQLSEQERQAALALLNSAEYRNLSPEQAVALAAENGTYIASERTMRRILAQEKQATYRERCKPARPRSKPRQFVADKPLQVLSWDITYLRNAAVRGSFFYLYLFIDIWSRRIVGWQVHEEQSAELAARLLRRLCQEHELETDAVLHADNGGPMKGATMLATMLDLGIVRSFSRPGVSDDNPFVEALFRHLKYAPAYPSHGFSSRDQAHDWVDRFVTWYNHRHLHSSIGYVTPDDRHHGRDLEIFETRRSVYAEACARNPRRWTASPKAWRRPRTVVLNPERTVHMQPQSTKAAA